MTRGVADTMRAALVLRRGDDEPVSLEIADFPVTLGRDSANQIPLSDSWVSRKHAQIVLEDDDTLVIQDLASNNGTFVNGRRVTSLHLEDGDVLKLGRSELEVCLKEPDDVPALGELQGWDLRPVSISPRRLESDITEEAEIEPRADPSSILGFFYQAGQILEGAFELDDILRRILDLSFQIIPAERGFVLLADPDTGEMVVRARKFRDEASADAAQGAELSTTILEYATRRGRGILTSDAAADDRFVGSKSIQTQAIRGAICVPLGGRAETPGAIYVDSRLSKHIFSVDDLKLLTALGAQMGIAVDNARLHEEEVKTQRLAAVGQAVAELGHCVKNILNGMEGGTYLLQRGIDRADGSSIRKGWSILKRNSARLKELMLDMLAYSKPRAPVYEEVEGNSVPGEVVELLHAKAEECGVDLRFLPGGDLPTLRVDSKALYRALLNLVTNAIDACPEREGRVEVATELLAGADQLRILVRDNGCGIPAEAMPKLGRAFFSTKGTAGTGLGLSVAYKVIAEHHGQIQVESSAGKGTTFAVTLPIR